VEAAARWALPTLVAAQARTQILAVCAHGHADEDMAAVAKTLSTRLGRRLAPQDGRPAPGGEAPRGD
jgi:hypothetical protein